MAEDEVTTDVLVNYVSGQIVSGPEDWIFEDIFDWIANAISTIVSSVTDWVNENIVPLYQTVKNWVTTRVNLVWGWIQDVWGWITTEVGKVWGWITTEVGKVWTWIVTEVGNLGSQVWGWIQQQWANISTSFSNLGANIAQWWDSLTITIGTYFSDLWLKVEAGWDWLTEWMTEHIVSPMATWWDQFLGRLFDFGQWIGPLLDTIWDWFSEDIPGESPRWMGIFKPPAEWLITRILKRVWEAATEYEEGDVTLLEDALGFLGKMFTDVFGRFMDGIMGLIGTMGPISPSTVVDNYKNLAGIGVATLGGLAAMTAASEFMNPLSHLGLGHISAMIYDMTNYKLITGAMLGALATTVIRTPITYYFNDLFRPWLLRPGDFMELMAREAFTAPEKLRVPELTSTVLAVTGGDGSAFESRMLGYYGYPGNYYGFFKELSFAPLRYFPLAGIARAGYWDEDWFTEALSRSGYSPTARAALMDMYREQVLVSRQLPVMYQVKRLSREGFATTEEIKAHLEKAAAMVDMTECRLFAMELEQEFSQKEMAFDIIMRSFSRGIIPEAEASRGLASLGIPEVMIDLHLMREKLGLMRRITIPAEAAAPPIIGVEE